MLTMGEKGIRVCDRWISNFLNFLEDMGTLPSPDHSIDRKDNDKGYEPGNCRWATQAEQSKNRKWTPWIRLGLSPERARELFDHSEGHFNRETAVAYGISLASVKRIRKHFKTVDEEETDE